MLTNKHKFNYGDLVKDGISGFTGKVMAFWHSQTGQVSVSLAPTGLDKHGKIKPWEQPEQCRLSLVEYRGDEYALDGPEGQEKFSLHDEVKETTTKTKGRVSQIGLFATGCIRYGIVPYTPPKEMKPGEELYFDEVELELIKRPKVKASKPTGGEENYPEFK